MKPEALVMLLLALAVTAFAPAARADEPPATSSAAPAATPQAPAHPAMHAERNSVVMMVTGISLMAVGVVASGVGTGAMIEGRRQCQSDRDASRCTGESVPVNAGLAAIIGGSTLTAIGLGLTIAGSIKVVVPDRATVTPVVRLGLGSISLSGTF